MTPETAVAIFAFMVIVTVVERFGK